MKQKMLQNFIQHDENHKLQQPQRFYKFFWEYVDPWKQHFVGKDFLKKLEKPILTLGFF